MKIVNIDRKFLHIFWTTWENSMKFSVKICFKIILKVTKNQGFTLFSENTFDHSIHLTPTLLPPPRHFRVKVFCTPYWFIPLSQKNYLTASTQLLSLQLYIWVYQIISRKLVFLSTVSITTFYYKILHKPWL